MIVKKRLTVIQVLLVLIFVGCCGYLGKYFYDSHKAESGFDELKKVVEKTERADATDGYIDKRADNGMLECYYSLYQKNNDMVGWIKIPDTPVDYPVVKYSDNEFYLHKNFNKEYQFSGIPFLDYQSNDESVNKIIYAHNMKNGTMFASLVDYEDKSFYDGHKNIMYDTLYDKGEYVTQAKSRSFYDTGVNTVYGDSLITLSTCAYHTSNERFVVIARKK